MARRKVASSKRGEKTSVAPVGQRPTDHPDAVDVEEGRHGEDDVVLAAALGHVGLEQVADQIAVGQHARPSAGPVVPLE